MIYFDNASTTKMIPEVRDSIYDIDENFWGNSSSVHNFGFRAEQKLKEARKIIAERFLVPNSDIYFTSGGTEANNLAIFGTCRHFYNRNRPLKVITSVTEHKSVLNCYKYLEKNGFIVSYIPVESDGKVNLEILEKEINKDTILVSIMHVNNETGCIHPIESVRKIIDSKKSKSLLHVDMVQSFGKLQNNIINYVDLATISAHKIHGPKGVGAIYIKNKNIITPLIFGGNQESGIRSGTENISGIVGFAKAAEIAYQNLETNFEHVEMLHKYLLDPIKNNFKEIEIISSLDSSPYIINLRFKNIKSDTLVNYLSHFDIFVSSGAACSSNSKDTGYVLSSMGYKNADENIRISFSNHNNSNEIDKFIKILKNAITFLK